MVRITTAFRKKYRKHHSALNSYLNNIRRWHINTLGVADRNVPIRIQKAVITLEPLHGAGFRLFENHLLADQNKDGAPLTGSGEGKAYG